LIFFPVGTSSLSSVAQMNYSRFSNYVRRSIFLLCRISKASPFLTVHPHIEFLDVPGSSDNNYRSSLLALIELVKTSPPLQRLVLDFVFRGVTSSTLTYRQWPYSRILPLPFVR